MLVTSGISLLTKIIVTFRKYVIFGRDI